MISIFLTYCENYINTENSNENIFLNQYENFNEIINDLKLDDKDQIIKDFDLEKQINLFKLEGSVNPRIYLSNGYKRTEKFYDLVYKDNWVNYIINSKNWLNENNIYSLFSNSPYAFILAIIHFSTLKGQPFEIRHFCIKTFIKKAKLGKLINENKCLNLIQLFENNKKSIKPIKNKLQALKQIIKISLFVKDLKKFYYSYNKNSDDINMQMLKKIKNMYLQEIYILKNSYKNVENNKFLKKFLDQLIIMKIYID